MWSNTWRSSQRKLTGSRSIAWRPVQWSASFWCIRTSSLFLWPPPGQMLSWHATHHSQLWPHTATGRYASLIQLPSAVIFSLPDCAPWSRTSMNISICLMMKLNAYWTFTRHCVPVIDAAVSTTLTNCLMRHDKTSSFAGVLNDHYRRTGLETDCYAYVSACSAACESIMKSHADHME